MAIFQRAWPDSDRPGRPTRPGRGAGRRRAERTVDRASNAVHRQDPVTAADVRPDAARALIWSLESGGWSRREAGNLVALLNGLRPARTGWTEREIEHLRFLRALADTGRLDH